MTSPSRPDATTTAAAVHDDRWAEWDQFVAAHPHGGFMQSASWIRCRAEDGYGHIAIMLRDEDHLLVGGAVVGRWAYGDNQAFLYIQEGPLLPDEPELAEAVMSAVLARLDQHRRGDTAVVSHLRIEPRRVDWPHFAAAGFASPSHDDRFREPRHTHCVDLRASEPERLLAMKPKGRYNVGLARRHGVTVIEDNTDRGLEDFHAIRNDTAQRQDLKRRPPRYFADMQREFGPPSSLRSLPPERVVSGFGRPGATDAPRAHFFFAELAGRRLACALVIRFGGRATYLYGGSLDEQREVMAPYLLHHEIMNRMAAAGCTCYDLWGTAPPGQREHEWAGISAFKRKFGGTEIAHVPTLDHVYDRAAYARFVETQSKPARSTGTTDKRATVPATDPARGLRDVQVWGECLPEPLHTTLRRSFGLERFERWRRDGLPFYRTTFWYRSDREPSHVVEQVIEVLREAARPSPQIIGAEWWFSVLSTNATPQWLLPCHFDRADLDETDPKRIRHPEVASVFFLNAVPYGELVITDQVLGEDGRPRPSEPRKMRFVPPGENRYAVFPGHLFHGVIGRMWRPEEDEFLRVSLAVNWWTERPAAPYLRDSGEAVQVFDLEAVPVDAACRAPAPCTTTSAVP